jgi:hypothetical protein
MRAGTQYDVLAAQAEQFGGTQPSLYGERQQSPVAAPAPSAKVWRGEKRFDLGGGEKCNRPTHEALARYGEYALCQAAVLWGMQGDVTEEGVNRGEPHVAASGAVAAVLLQVIEEGSEERRIQIVEGQIGRRLSQSLLCVVQEQTKGIAVARNGVCAGLALSHEPIGEE